LNTRLSKRKFKQLFTAPSTICPAITGLFTNEDISADEFIINYTGRLVVSSGDSRDEYDFRLLELKHSKGLCYGFETSVDVTLEAFDLCNLMRFANFTDKYN
jgi:hypothetical protein